MTRLRPLLLPGGLIVVGGFLAFAGSVILIHLVDTATGGAGTGQSVTYRVVIGAFWIVAVGLGLVIGLMTRKPRTALWVSAAALCTGAVLLWIPLFAIPKVP